MKEDTNEEIKLLTAKLADKQEAILEEWEKKLRETEGKSSELAAMSRQEFRNNIPHFLQRLYDSLKGKEISVSEIGKGHGAHRWEYGYDLQQTVKEWGILNKVLVKEVNSLQEEFSSAVLVTFHEALGTHIQEGIEYSVREFDQLRNRETEAQLFDVQEALEEREEVSRDRSLRSTSHDLKGIMKNLQMGFFLLDDQDLNPRATELIDQMKTAADSLEQLLNDLLDLFRLETHREEINVSEFDVAELLRGLCESMQPLAQTEELELKYSGDESLPVKTDQKKLQRIVRNIMSNAIKYTEEGQVEVTWKDFSATQWQLKISDTGPGLHATHAKSLTKETESSDEVPEAADNQGEGIGLLIVRHLSKLLDGIIKVKTKRGVGTTFKIVFPKELNVEK